MFKVSLPSNFEKMDSEEIEYDGGGKDVPWWGWLIVGIGSAAIIGAGAYLLRKKPTEFVEDDSIDFPKMDDYKTMTENGWHYVGRISGTMKGEIMKQGWSLNWTMSEKGNFMWWYRP